MIYDITPLLSPCLGVWPGDTPLTREVLCDLRQGDNITLSTLHATVHLGAHADAPSHYGADASTIDERSLDYYLGPCQVVRIAVPHGVRIMPDLLANPIRANRVLIATGTFPDPVFNSTPISPPSAPNWCAVCTNRASNSSASTRRASISSTPRICRVIKPFCDMIWRYWKDWF